VRILLERVREVCLEAYTHQDLPFERLVGEMNPERHLSRSPLFQVMFALQNVPAPELHMGELELDVVEGGNPARFDLDITLQESNGMLIGGVVYATDLLDRSTVERMLGQWQRLLEALVGDPDQRISQLDVLGKQDRQQLLVDWNRTATVYPHSSNSTLSGLFEEQVYRTPKSVALECNGHAFSYEDLNGRANRLARYLAYCGVGPGTLVGICAERSVEMVTGLLAVLKAGGAYVPLDPEYPAERLKLLLQNTAPAVVLTQGHLREQIPDVAGARVFNLDTDWGLVAQQSTANLGNTAQEDDAAYVIYTSGSSGGPKGVVNTHAGIRNRLLWMQERFGLEVGEGVLQKTSFSFDVSVWEFFWPLMTGARLVLAIPGGHRDNRYLVETIRKQEITTLHFVPSMLGSFLTEPGIADCTSLRRVICSGEVLSADMAGRFHKFCSAELHNLYGPTEAAVDVTHYQCLKDREVNAVPIGRPIANTQIYILDEEMNPVPLGARGELYIAGAGLARGYLGRPELTAERFLPDPFSEDPGARLYATGDLARYQYDGNIQYMGRLDEQVKIRGYRVEPLEIEKMLREIPEIRDAAVVAREDDSGEKRLVAYLVARVNNQQLSVAELRTQLEKSLPRYMVPSFFVYLHQLPLTPSGKLNRRLLPAPGAKRPDVGRDYVAPCTPTEVLLCGVWKKVLGLDSVGVTDNFFELGGDSLLGLRVIAEARQSGLELSVRHLFESPTIAGLATLSASNELEGKEIAFSSTKPGALVSEADRRHLPDDVEDAYPLARLQAGMLFHSEYSPESTVYHTVSTLHIEGRLDIEVFRRVIEETLARHAILRTSFDLANYSEPLQLVHRKSDLSVEVDDIAELSEPQQEERLKVWLEAEKKQAFDLSRAGLLRFRIHRRSAQAFQFTMSSHHAIEDGWSGASLLTEIFSSYFGALQGQESAISSPRSSFRDFVSLERQTLDWKPAREYWSRQLAEINVPSMPWKATSSGDTQGVSLEVRISPETSEKLKYLAGKANVPLKSVALAVHLRVMQLLGGQDDVTTGLISNGRLEVSDGERVQGCFLNTLPMRMQLRGGSWIALVRETAAVERDLLLYRRFPLAELQRMAGGISLFDTAFNFAHFHVLKKLRETPGLTILGGQGASQTNFPLLAQFALDLVDANLHLQLDFDETRIGKNQMERIAGYYQTTLSRMADDPEERYESAFLLSDLERQQVLVEWNQTDQATQAKCLPQLFEEQVERTPEHLAVFFEGRELTYRELNRRANQLAHHLRSLGVAPDTRVAICVERSFDLVVGLLGILKAGGAYVPLDPAYPLERLKSMVEQSQATVLLTERSLGVDISRNSLQLVYMDSDWPAIASFPTENPRTAIHPDHLLYVIYTSGSTGTPKGIGLAHRPLVNLLEWHWSVLPKAARTLQFTSLSFDPSFHEIFSELCSGGSIFVISEEMRRDVPRLARFILENSIEKIMVPVMMLDQLSNEFAQHPEFASLALKHFISTGEQLEITNPVTQFFGAQQCTLHNHYGPAETHVCTAYTQPGEPETWEPRPPIGRPIANTQIYILDKNLNPVPIGVRGELFVGGISLARGYSGRADLTAERFIPNPYCTAPGERLYQSGDTALYRENGDILYLGRMDDQVKIRGCRVELGEIDAVLREHKSIKDVAVVARKSESGQQKVYAYVVAKVGEKPSVNELRNALKMKLPDFMIPSAFVFLNALPVNPNGKLDRRALPEPDGTRPELEQTYFPPQSALEKLLCHLFAGVLGLERVGVADSFFDLGGHSLLATTLVSRIRTTFGVSLPLSQLFSHPTVRLLVPVLEKSVESGNRTSGIDRILSLVEGLPAEKVQAMVSAKATVPEAGEIGGAMAE
jgi:amino acid adenylation domain-containing protein